MHWSLFSLIALLTLLRIPNVAALPAPQDGLSDLILEPGAKVSAKNKIGRTRASKINVKIKKPARLVPKKDLKASLFKKASSMYRNAAAKSENPTFTVKKGKLVLSKNRRKIVLHGYDADHILEGQTVKHAAQKGGHTAQRVFHLLYVSLAPALKAIKDRLNHPDNMAFVDGETNRAKGRVHQAIQLGRTFVKNGVVAEYLKQTKAAGIATARDIDMILRSHGIKNINVSKEHKKVLKAHGVKRRGHTEVGVH